jgi:hypothetical protein
MDVALCGVGVGLVEIGAIEISVVIRVISELHFASCLGKSGRKGGSLEKKRRGSGFIRSGRESREYERGDGKIMMEARRAG